MKFKRTVLLVCFLLTGAALIAGFVKRSKTADIPAVSDSEMDDFTLNLVFERTEKLTVPTLAELQNKATEILYVEPFARKMSQNLDMYSAARVRKVIKSGSALQEGETIWIYEPCLFYQRPAGQEFAGALQEPGWISCPYYSLPMCQQTEYLIFLIRPEYPPEYRQSEEAKRTFLYAFPCASSFSPEHREVFLIPSQEENSAAERELEELLSRPDSAAYESRIRALQEQIIQEHAAQRMTWKQVKEYGFAADSQETKDRLSALEEEIFEYYQ